MAARRAHRKLDRAIRVAAVLGLALIAFSLISAFCLVIYQQPPGIVTAPPPPGSPPGTPLTLVTPGGDIRVQVFAGRVIVCDGRFPWGTKRVGMTLGVMKNAGFTIVWNTPAAVWRAIQQRSYWEYHFYREQVQVNFLPVGVILLIPWALRRWVWKVPTSWQCQSCRYDLRGSAQGPCPECGTTRPLTTT
jgi:hypothetical protein